MKDDKAGEAYGLASEEIGHTRNDFTPKITVLDLQRDERRHPGCVRRGYNMKL